jgi:hypothetical protein
MYMYRVAFILFSIISSLLLSAVTQPSVSAQQETGITISPLRLEGEIDPGFVFSGKFQVKNSGTEARNITVSAETFNVTNQAYDYLFKPNTAEVSWVSFSTTSLSLAPDESAIVSYQVNVPIGTEPGGYYLAFFATNQSPASLGGISPTERVTSLLYLSVSGEASRSGQLVQLRSPFVVWGDTNWSATLQNSGTLHYRSAYASSVRSIFNHQVSSHEDSRLILPGTVRLIEGTLVAPSVLGLYKVVYTVSLGDSPQVEHTRWFLYLPPLQVILAGLIIIGIVILLRRQKS